MVFLLKIDKWKIKARVVKKSEMKTFLKKNSRDSN